MRATVSQDPARQFDPKTMHSLGYTLVASALMALGTVATVLAVVYPVTAGGVAALVFGSWLAERTLRRFYRTRQRAGRTRKVCVPKTGVCVEL